MISKGGVVGRIERTLFIIEWLLDADMQRRAQIGLNKGESHHALKNALRIGQQGKIHDRTAEGQHYRMALLNLLAAIIICWNTKHLAHAAAARMDEGLDCPPELLAHISLLGWAHMLINSTGVVPAAVSNILSDLSRWFLVIAIAALGVKTSLAAMLDLGGRHVLLVVAQTLLLLGVAIGVVMTGILA